MATAEERLTVLKMLEAGTISPDEARQLLAALAGNRGARTTPDRETRSLRIRFRDAATGREKYLATVPLPILDAALQWGGGIAARIPHEQLQGILAAVRVGQPSKIVDFFDEESGDRIEIFIE